GGRRDVGGQKGEGKSKLHRELLGMRVPENRGPWPHDRGHGRNLAIRSKRARLFPAQSSSKKFREGDRVAGSAPGCYAESSSIRFTARSARTRTSSATGTSGAR